MRDSLIAKEPCGAPARCVWWLSCMNKRSKTLRGARAALDHGDIETRTAKINHAIVVIGHLQSSLDSNKAGQSPEIWSVSIWLVRAALVDAQCRQSATLLEEQIALLMQVHEAWCEVERRNAARGGGCGAD